MPDSTPGGTSPDDTSGGGTPGDGTSGDGALLGRSGDGRGRAGRMRTDRVRAVALLAAAVLQIVAGALGGTGAWGEPVGTVADAYPHPLLPAGTAFSIWSLIYVAVLALAVRQVLPSQRGREVHRRTGWWLVGAGVCNIAWVALFGQRWVLPAQVVIVALLGCLLAAWVAASRVPARDRGDRLLLHGPVALYTGWVAVATVVGAVTTAVAFGAAVPVPAAAGVLLVTAVAAGFAIAWLRAVVPFALAVVWALSWIAVRTGDAAVAVTAVVAVLVLLVVTVRAVVTAPRGRTRARRRTRAAASTARGEVAWG